MRIRPLEDILLEMEPLMEEAFDDHGLQAGDFIGLMYIWAMTHRPDSLETYTEDGTSPELVLKSDGTIFYGPKRR